MNLILTDATSVAKIIGCPPQQLRHNARENIWTFVRAIPPEEGKTQYRYHTVSTELAKFLGLTLEELDRRLRDAK